MISFFVLKPKCKNLCENIGIGITNNNAIINAYNKTQFEQAKVKIFKLLAIIGKSKAIAPTGDAKPKKKFF